MRKLYSICIGLLFCALLAGVVRAETFELADGQGLTGDVVSFNEEGIILRLPDDKYSDRVAWGKFSQADLRKLAQNPKISALVSPFIEVSEADRLKQAEIKINDVPRLARPPARSVLGSMFSSGVGVFVLLLLYAANIYAGYETAIFRARPVGLVCGVSAVLPLIGPIIFLSMPTQLESVAPETANAPAAPTPTFAVGAPPPSEPEAASTGGVRLATSGSAPAGAPQTQTFQRGAFTFNRRFFETKFPGFFGMVRRDADKDMVLAIKTGRGHFIGHRITRITGNDMHVEVAKGGGHEEITIPFTEIQEIQLKHKDA